MTKLLNFIDQLATWRGMVILMACFGVVFGLIATTLSQLSEVSGGHGILDFEIGYTMARVQEVLGSYGSEGMALYRRIQLLDLLNPALYALIAAALTALVWRGIGPRWLAALPLLGGLGDYLENISLYLITQSFPNLSEGLVATSSFLSLVKNGLLSIGMLPLIVGVALRVWRSVSEASS